MLKPSLYPTRTCTLVLALGMSACGGGTENAISEGNVDLPNAATDTSPAEELARSATVIIEERGGKTVFDAWYNAAPESYLTSLPTDQSNDVCNVVEHKTEVPLPNTLHGGPTITIASSSQTLASLAPQQIDAVTVYTTDERWSDIAVPNDAMLSFDNTSVFHDLSPVPLSALEPFEWIEPTTGALTSIDGILQWQPAASDNNRIELNLSTSNALSPNFTSIAVVCHLVDDGEFVLNSDTQQILGGGESRVLVRGLRLRHQTLESDGASLAVVQISHEI